MSRTLAMATPQQSFNIGLLDTAAIVNRVGATARRRQSRTAALVARAFVSNDVRLDKVIALRAAIAAGTYFVSAASLASHLMLSMHAPAAVHAYRNSALKP